MASTTPQDGPPQPPQPPPPPQLNKKARAKLAKETINTLIPQLLKSNERARAGAANSKLIRYDASLAPKGPPPSGAKPKASSAAAAATAPTIRVIKSDTLDAAHALYKAHPGSHTRVAALNMASPLQPGGGVLNGARAQEESLCVRSTLYASLREGFYRLPEDGAVYSPDVLVFRASSGSGSGGGADHGLLPKREWWWADVISCAALRFPDTVGGGGDGEPEKKYESEGAREAMTLKVRLILQVAAQRAVTHLVLGALGCGAYGNPPAEVARIFKRVICGDRRRKGVTVGESGIEEIVFAIFDEGENLRTFAEVFADVAVTDGS